MAVQPCSTMLRYADSVCSGASSPEPRWAMKKRGPARKSLAVGTLPCCPQPLVTALEATQKAPDATQKPDAAQKPDASPKK